MRTNNLEELLKTVERIRVEKYPHIPQELVRQIITREFDNQDSRSYASEQVRSLIVDYLDEKGV